MFKRIMLTLTFAAALGTAGLCLTDNANARWGRGWGWGGRPYVSSYYGPSYYYSGYRPYRAYYRNYYAATPYYYNSYYYGSPDYYYQPVPRVAVRVGPWWR